MLEGKAQIATEYLVITGFLLTVVTVVFGYSYVNYEQSVKVSQANTLLDALVNKADYVYALGPDNNQFAELLIPTNAISINVMNLCVNGEKLLSDPYNPAPAQRGFCDQGAQNGISRSGVELTVGLVGGPTTISRVAKAPLELHKDQQGVNFPCASSTICDGKFSIKVFWVPGEKKVFLQKV